MDINVWAVGAPTAAAFVISSYEIDLNAKNAKVFARRADVRRCGSLAEGHTRHDPRQGCCDPRR
jgi:hypothetical protein